MNTNTNIPTFQAGDVVKLQFDCTGNGGESVQVRTAVTVEDLGLAIANPNAEAVAVNVEFDSVTYSNYLTQSMNMDLPEAERTQAKANAVALLGNFHAATAVQIQAGTATPGESIVTAVVNYAVANGLPDSKGFNQVFSREDTATAYRLTENELNVSARHEVVDVGGVFVVSATATWG